MQRLPQGRLLPLSSILAPPQLTLSSSTQTETNTPPHTGAPSSCLSLESASPLPLPYSRSSLSSTASRPCKIIRSKQRRLEGQKTFLLAGKRRERNLFPTSINPKNDRYFVKVTCNNANAQSWAPRSDMLSPWGGGGARSWHGGASIELKEGFPAAAAPASYPTELQQFLVLGNQF